ncbi:cold-shock protein [Micrococcales bacterium 31B]|nr:cold-shock protein [Micrococcales bacterium 31B]
MPTGKVKFYSADKGFGFIAGDDAAEVYVHASALPAGVQELKPGMRVDYDVAEGRKGAQALSVRLLEEAPSIARAKRKKPEDMVVIVEDLIKLLDAFSNDFRRGRYPDKGRATKVAQVMRVVADDFEA